MGDRDPASALIPIPLLRGRLLDLIEEPPPYHAIYRAVVDGQVPARWVRGRWYVREADLPEIARLLKARAQGRVAPRAAAAEHIAA